MPHVLPESTPESQGLPTAAVLSLIDELEQGGLDPHALVIARHGQVLFRGADVTGADDCDSMWGHVNWSGRPDRSGDGRCRACDGRQPALHTFAWR